MRLPILLTTAFCLSLLFGTTVNAEEPPRVSFFFNLLEKHKTRENAEKQQKSETLSRIRLFESNKSQEMTLNEGVREDQERSREFPNGLREGLRWLFSKEVVDQQMRTESRLNPFRTKRYFADTASNTVRRGVFDRFTNGSEKPVGMFIPNRYQIFHRNLENPRIEIIRLDLALKNIVKEDSEVMFEDLGKAQRDGFSVSRWVRSVEGHVNPSGSFSSVFRWLDRRKSIEVSSDFRNDAGTFIDAEVELGNAWNKIFFNHEPDVAKASEYYRIWRRTLSNRVGLLDNFDLAPTESERKRARRSQSAARGFINEQKRFFTQRLAVLEKVISSGEKLIESETYGDMTSAFIAQQIRRSKNQIVVTTNQLNEENSDILEVAFPGGNSSSLQYQVPAWALDTGDDLTATDQPDSTDS